MANSTVERPLLFFINQIRNFMNYFAKGKNGKSTQDPVSNAEMSLGKTMEQYFSNTFSHLSPGEEEKRPSGHVLKKTNDRWIIERGNVDITLPFNGGNPTVRKVCNTIRSSKKRIEIMKDCKRALLPKEI
jgi:hypothetical protein